MNRNIAKPFAATLSLLDVASDKTHKYKCFHGEDVQLTVNVVGEDQRRLDLSNTSVKIYFTLDKNVNEPVYRQDAGIVVNNFGVITVMLEKSYIRIGNNTLKIVLYDEDQTVFLQPLIISCIDPLIGEEADLEIPDDINVRDEIYDIRRIIGDLQDFDDDLGREIIEARNEYGTVGRRLDNFDSQLDTKVSYSTNSKVHFIKTMSKGGDCILIESTKNILIDVGYATNGITLINYLINNNINTIDYLIISHHHEDHVGGANAEGFIALCNSSINIEKVVLPHQKINYSLFVQSSSYKVGEIIKGINDKVVNCCNTLSIPIHYPQDEEIIQLNNDSYIKFLNLKESNFNKYYNHTVDAYLVDENYTNYNNFSMVVEYHNGNNGFLFSSDIEELAQELIYSQLNGNIDVLKIEHHSVNYNCCDKYFNKIHPKIAVVMPLLTNEDVGFIKNQHFNELVNNGVPIYSTESGSVVIKSDYSGVCVLTDSTNINRLETYNLSQGIALQDGTDLDDIREVGIYNSINATRTNTMINTPFKGAGFKLIVEKTGLYNCLKQTCIINNDQRSLCYTRQTKERVWGDWRRISPYNEIGMAISNIDLNDLKTPGEYYSENTANTTTITNAPVKSGFRIEVKQITGGTILQKVIANSDNIQEFYRYFGNNSWQPWYTYTSSKYLKSETIETVYGQGKEIPTNSDLNSYTTPGNYSCFNETVSTTVTNKPDGITTGFRLEVKATNNDIRYQILYVNDDNIAIYIRYYDVKIGFTSWKKLKFE